MKAVFGIILFLLLTVTTSGIASVQAQSFKESPALTEKTTWLDQFIDDVSKQDHGALLGLTKAQLLKKLAPKHTPKCSTDWRPSKDLTYFRSSGIDSTITLQFAYKGGKVAKVREIRWYGYPRPSNNKEIEYGKWITTADVRRH